MFLTGHILGPYQMMEITECIHMNPAAGRGPKTELPRTEDRSLHVANIFHFMYKAQLQYPKTITCKKTRLCLPRR